MAAIFQTTCLVSFFNDFFVILIHISIKFIPNGPINN